MCESIHFPETSKDLVVRRHNSTQICTLLALGVSVCFIPCTWPNILHLKKPHVFYLHIASCPDYRRIYKRMFPNLALKMNPIAVESSTVYAISGSCAPCKALLHLSNCNVISLYHQAEKMHHTKAVGNGWLGQGCPQLICPGHYSLCRGYPAQKHILYSEKVLEGNVLTFLSSLY